jgi:hypothetical protein
MENITKVLGTSDVEKIELCTARKYQHAVKINLEMVRADWFPVMSQLPHDIHDQHNCTVHTVL